MTLGKFFRWAEEAPRRLDTLSRVEAVSDPDGTFEDVRRIVEAVFRGQVSFRKGWETVSGELREAFAPGTILGDFLLFASPESPQQLRDEAEARLMDRGFPVFRAVRTANPKMDSEIRERIAEQNRSRSDGEREITRADVEREITWTALCIAVRILGEWGQGKEHRKPEQKEVDLGDGSPVILREVTPLVLAGVLSGDAATLGDRLLRASIVGCGTWRAASPGEVDVFLQDEYGPGETTILLREARGFITYSLDRREKWINFAKAEWAKAASDDLLGPGGENRERIHRKFGPDPASLFNWGEKSSKALEVGLALELTGAVLAEEIGALPRPDTPDQFSEIIAEDLARRIVRESNFTPAEEELFHALRSGETPEEIAERTGKSPGAIWGMTFRYRKKIPPHLKELSKKP